MKINWRGLYLFSFYFLPKSLDSGCDNGEVVVLKWLRGRQDVELVMIVLTGWWSISNGFGSRWWPALWRLDVLTGLGTRVASHAPVMINSPSSALSLGWHSQRTHAVISTVQLTARAIRLWLLLWQLAGDFSQNSPRRLDRFSSSERIWESLFLVNICCPRWKCWQWQQCWWFSLPSAWLRNIPITSSPLINQKTEG